MSADIITWVICGAAIYACAYIIYLQGRISALDWSTQCVDALHSGQPMPASNNRFFRHNLLELLLLLIPLYLLMPN